MITDSFGRSFPYLRLSITDSCNFRCQYCLPNGMDKSKNKYLTLHEIDNLLPACVDLGVKKIRLTGGEPTLRKDFTDILRKISAHPQIITRAVTTNGLYLEKKAKEWYEAGLNHINISIDSLNPKRFKSITGRDCLHTILLGIDKAIELKFESIKINAVLINDLTEDEFYNFISWIKDKPVTLRFIELMETGDNKQYFSAKHARSAFWSNLLISEGWVKQEREFISGPALVYKKPNFQGMIGFISPYANKFCDDCNRFRISSNGNLHLCLFGNAVYSIRPLLQSPEDKANLVACIKDRFSLKRKSHSLHLGDFGVTAHFASIGG